MARIREGCGISCPDWHAWERDLKKAATRQEMPISDEDLDRFRHALADVHVKSSDQQRMEVEYRLQRFGAKMWRRILSRLDAAEAALSPGDQGERERIVVWLRTYADEDRYGPRWRPLHFAAAAIERGAHLPTAAQEGRDDGQ